MAQEDYVILIARLIIAQVAKLLFRRDGTFFDKEVKKSIDDRYI